jgi:peptidoglycan/xylan/chitin deacetylase (PgdA/CDA1 family)
MRGLGRIATVLVAAVCLVPPAVMVRPADAQPTGRMAPVVSKVDTSQPVVFLTIDDGIVRDPAAPDRIRKSNAHPALFLTQRYVQGHDDYFGGLRLAGASIENHTIDHPNLKGRHYEFQRQEICATSDYYAKVYGRRPVLFRPPYGSYDDTTRAAAADCGIAYVVNWTATVDDGVVRFQTGNRLERGDIVLMHFRTTFTKDYTAFLDQAAHAGLTPAVLTDFLR